MNHTGYLLFSLALVMSALAMLLFLHLTRLFRLRKGIFTSIRIKPLLLSTGLVYSSIFVLNIFVMWFPLEDHLETQFEGLSHNLLGVFSISILAPLLEEVLFRGAIQGYLMRHFKKPWVAIIISALIFGIYHMNPVQVVYATLLGIVLGWIYYRTGNLLSVIVGHILNNSMATFSMLFLSDAMDSDVAVSDGIINEIISGVHFGGLMALSIFLAIKLHRSLPAVPKPWHESDEVPCEEPEQDALK
jgi:membrane protease YdiL (CAAX protease family)